MCIYIYIYILILISIHIIMCVYIYIYVDMLRQHTSIHTPRALVRHAGARRWCLARPAKQNI